MRPSFQRLFCLSLLFLLFLLAACTRAERELSTPTETLPVLVSTATLPATSTQPVTPTRKPTLAPTATRTRMPSITPGPTMTPFPTRTATYEMTATPWPTLTPILASAFTPTLDVSSIVTRTPAPAAQCPVENPDMRIDLGQITEKVGQTILDFLNEGGTRKAVIDAYLLKYPRADDKTIQENDVTGDGIPELLLTVPDALIIYTCQDGIYVTPPHYLLTYHFYEPIITHIEDLNMDGVDEIVAFAGDERYRFITILEWDGSIYQILNWLPDDRQELCATLLGPSTFEFSDEDKSGLPELILYQTIPIWGEYIDGLPWREETRTCSWNGTMYVHTHTEYAPPEYRFQAVQDGDRAMLVGKYDEALDLYQQAIFSDQLDWWSGERKLYEAQTFSSENLIKPTPLPSLLPNPNEYFYLAAYARFRILLIHLLRGYLSDAEIVYNTLQEKFPAGQPGTEFAEMAALFWNEYQTSSDIGLSCAAAIQYISNYPDILTTYLGDYYHGLQSPTYTPPDVCPSTSTP